MKYIKRINTNKRISVMIVISMLLVFLLLCSFGKFSSVSDDSSGQTNLLYGTGDIRTVRQDLLVSPNVLYDDKYLYWGGSDENYTRQLFRVSLDAGGEPELVCQRIGCTHQDPDCILQPFFSDPNYGFIPYVLGDRLVYASSNRAENNLSIYAMDMQGREKTCIVESELFFIMTDPLTNKEMESIYGFDGIRQMDEGFIVMSKNPYLVILDSDFKEFNRIYCTGSRVVYTENDLFWMSGLQFVNYDLREGELHRDILDLGESASGEYYCWDGKLYYYTEGWLTSVDADSLESARVMEIDLLDTESTVNPFTVAEGYFFALTENGVLVYDLAENTGAQLFEEVTVLPMGMVDGRAYFNQDGRIVVKQL